MGNRNEADESMLIRLLEDFIDAGLHGRFEEALALIDEPYVGVGMGEQGIVRNKEQAELVLKGGYRPSDDVAITYELTNLTVNFVNDDSAVVLSQVDITNTPKNGKPLRSGLMQTIGARRRGQGWGIAFTHASPTVLTVESVEAYPIRFMDHTISLIKAGLQAETVLYAEVNLTQNTVVRMECKASDWAQEYELHTLEEVVGIGMHGKLEASTQQEYYAFWNRLRLLGLYVEGVVKDHFDYRIHTEQGDVWMRSAVEMVRQAYSGDVMAVISYSGLDSQKMELEQYTHKAFHDALTGLLNRDGFENRVTELLQSYDPQNNIALLMIDLDDFKQINDRLGHQMGDTVLHQVAGVLRAAFRSEDAVGRWGGDEFMVLMTGGFTSTALEKKAGELLDSMKLCIDGNKQISVSVSIGVAYGHAYATFEKLYRIADIALYTAKKAGKCRYHLINSDTNIEHSSSGVGANLLSLQTLLDYTDGNDTIQRKTPYEALVENIPGSVLVIYLADRVWLTHCNDWTSRFTGYTSAEIEELQKDNALALTHPDDMESMQEMIRRMYAGMEKVHFVYRLRRKDGTYGHVQINASMTERTKNEIVFHGIETDVEEVVQLKQEVEYAHSRLETLVNTMPGGVVIITMTDHLQTFHCNNWVSRSLGYSQEELNKMEAENSLILVHPDDLYIAREAMEQMHAGADSISPIYRLMAKDGTYRHVLVKASLTQYSPEKSIYYGVITDVEEMIEIQGKLEYSRKQLEALVTAIPGGIAIFEITDTLKVTQYGNWFCRFTGYDSIEESEQARQGKQFATVWPEDVPRTQEALHRVCDGVDSVFISVRVKCKNGAPKWVDIRGSVIEREHGKVTMYVIYTEPDTGAAK